jgi:mRNA-degrading endonuclease toxin of MazEF toxin-antitoxin module
MDFDIDKMYCGAIKRGDIFLYENESKKILTVVVLQDNILNDGLPTVVCALVAPYKKNEEIFANEVLLKKDEIGLGVDGICMLHKIMTINRHNLVAKKAELKSERLQQIYQALDINCGRFRDR